MSAKVTAKAVSQVQNQLPAFIGEDFPLYQKFMEYYYEFMETLCVYYSGYTVDQLAAIKLEESIDGFLLLDSTDGTANVGENVLTEEIARTSANAFTVGETVTGQTSGATATAKAKGAFTGINKVFLEPTNNIDFAVDEVILGSTSTARGTITSISRKPLNATKTFKDLIDSDETTAGLLKSFKKELYPNVRDDASVDLKYFIKHLKEFYRSKGSEKSFQTLFRALYAQESLDFYYPKTDLLKVSDGNWAQDTILQLDYDVSYFDFNGLTITGLTSGSTAFVSNVTTRKLGTITLIELVLTNESGVFTVGETFTATLVSGSTLSAIILGMLTDIEITDGGTGYDIGDTITIVSDTTHLELEDLPGADGFQGFLLQEDGLPETRSAYTSDSSSEGIMNNEDGADLVGFGAVATVTATTGDQVTLMPITSGGNGFQLDDSFTFDNTDTNVEVTAEAVVATVKDTYQVERLTTQLFEAVETVTFNITGATVVVPFSVSVVAGYLVANDVIFSDATKVGEVISISDSEIRVYDRSNENSALGAIINGDFLFLFDSDGVAISGATSVVVFDSSLTNPSEDVAFNAANYTTATAGLLSLSGTYSRTGTTVTNTIAAGHNAYQFFTINNAFSSDPVADDMLTDNSTFGSATKKFTVIRYASETKTVFGHSTLGTFSSGNTVNLVNPNGIGQVLLEDQIPTTSGTYSGTVSTEGELLQDDDFPTTSILYNGSISGEGRINSEDINIDVDGGTALNSTISGLSITHDFTSGTISGTGDDGAVFTPTTVANSSVFTITTSGTGSTTGAVTLISNANTAMKSAMTIESQTFGTVNTIAITSHGSGYESIPTVSLQNSYYEDRGEVDSVNGGFLGSNANVTIGTLGGTVTDVTVSEYGHGYLTDPSVTAPVQSTQATLTPVITPTKTKVGVFTDESGQPSSRKKVQDNDYYQDYSYVLQTTDSINVWQEDVLKLLHPAGFKLFGEVAIVTLLNSQMFDRGNNNINSLDDDGKAIYRDMEMKFLTLMLDNAKIKVSTELNQEVEFKVTPTEIQMTLGVPAMRLEDSIEGTLLLEDDIPVSSVDYGVGEHSNFGRIRIEAEGIESVVELLNLILQSSGNPAEFFSLMSVKDVSLITSEKYIYLESYYDDGALLNETGDYVLAEETRTKITTSEPHFFHENDEVYLDEFIGNNLEDINGTRFRVTDIEHEANLILEDGEFLLQEDGIVTGTLTATADGTHSNFGLFTTENGLEFTLSESGLPDDRTNIDFDMSNETITTNGKIFRSNKEISSGIDPFGGLMRNEHIGEFADYQIHEYEFTAPADFTDSTFVVGDTLVTRPRFLEIESQIILDSTDGTANAGEAILLEDSLPTTDGTYSGTVSNMGKLLANIGKIDINTTAVNDEIIITDSEFVKIGANYISDEDDVTDNIVLDSTDGTSNAGEKIMTEDSIIQVNNSDSTRQIIHLEKPFTYKGVPHENNNGFLFHRHRIDQRVSV
tara:strand:+ start:1917 stop:6359 length:4443 start_codon:yes stop_codon:yes gene_type:complete